METSPQVRMIKCPHCGWIREVPVAALEDASAASVIMGGPDALGHAVTRAGNVLREIGERIAAALHDPALDAANAWLDLPACPHCQKPYRYSVQTGECKP